MQRLMVVFGFLLFLSFKVEACEGIGNGASGCADYVRGVQTESGVLVELTVSPINWSDGHVCEGVNVVQFGGTDLEKQAALSIGMASYLAGKGPIFFRCSEKLSSTTCRCTNIALGNSRRD